MFLSERSYDLRGKTSENGFLFDVGAGFFIESDFTNSENGANRVSLAAFVRA